jgi:NADH:ubiquinone oxidoreductase subunit 5 (subunit L)/multisubunit Na+/H+ antiporter MnhA subunit
MMLQQAPWYILLLPFLSLAIIAFILRPFFNNRPRLGGYVTIGAIAIACGLSFWVLAGVINAPGHKLEMATIPWLTIGNLKIGVGLMIDALTAIMLVVVTWPMIPAITATLPSCHCSPAACWDW